MSHPSATARPQPLGALVSDDRDERPGAERLDRRRASSAVSTPPDDVLLVAACRAGDRRAMEELYHRYKRRVYGLVVRIVGASDADEVAQEAFVRIYRGLPRFRGDAALSTWIYRLAVNAALSHLERRPARAEGEEALSQVQAPPGPERDPRLAGRLQAAMAQLPAGYRAVLVLHDVEGLSHEEIGEILGVRTGTSKSQLFKARARMRALLGEGIR